MCAVLDRDAIEGVEVVVAWRMRGHHHVPRHLKSQLSQLSSRSPFLTIAHRQGELTSSVVNAPMVPPEVLKELAPFVDLAQVRWVCQAGATFVGNII